MLIELIGASGSGKTTLISSINNHDGKYFLYSSADSSYKLHKDDKRFYCDFFGKDQIFLNKCIDIVSKSSFKPTQKQSSINMIINSYGDKFELDKMRESHKIIVDEFLLHRAFSTLLFSDDFVKDVHWFFSNVPLPDTLIILKCEQDVLLKRIKDRDKEVNTYLYLSETEILWLLEKSKYMFEVAEKLISLRGVPVFVLNTSGEIKKTQADFAFLLESLNVK